jgi:hypothetical protein
MQCAIEALLIIWNSELVQQSGFQRRTFSFMWFQETVLRYIASAPTAQRMPPPTVFFCATWPWIGLGREHHSSAAAFRQLPSNGWCIVACFAAAAQQRLSQYLFIYLFFESHFICKLYMYKSIFGLRTRRRVGQKSVCIQKVLRPANTINFFRGFPWYPNSTLHSMWLWLWAGPLCSWG